MILPGPEAQQLATYIGWLLHGGKGGLTAGMLFVVPSMFILYGLSAIYVSYGQVPWIYALFNGLKPAVIAIVILAVIKIGKKSLLSPFHYFISLAAFICIYFLDIPFPMIILGAIVMGALTGKWLPGFSKANTVVRTQRETDEAEYFINKNTITPAKGFKPSGFLKQISTGLLLWAIPFPAFYWLTSDFEFWKQLSLFFTKAAFVTFGGLMLFCPTLPR